MDDNFIGEWITELGRPASTSSIDGSELIERIRSLEELKAAAAAAQALAAAEYDDVRRAAHAAAGLPRDRLGQGVAAEVALARRESPNRGNRHLGLAKALVNEMPHTLRQLAAGRLSEWRATLLVRETACLTVEHRARVDEALCADMETLTGMGDRQLAMEVRKWACRLDPESVVRRARKAENERTVTCRPAPDTMTYLTALLPVAQGIAVYSALQREADALRARGDARGRGQLMADVLVERVTGRAPADGLRIEIQLVMTDDALLRGSAEPAVLPGYGVIPAGRARSLIRRHAVSEPGERAAVWVRRLYMAPAAGSLVAMDSRARLFPPGLARFLRVRDLTCRTPWCDAPIRHYDHILRHSTGGATSASNGQGLCERCNQVKEAPGWNSIRVPGVRHTVRITTPTGQVYRSAAPPLPGFVAPGARGPRSRPTVSLRRLTG